MIKGGYCMIDCKGLNLLGGSTPQTIAGLFDESVKALASGKAIFAHNCIYGTGHPMSPVAVMGQRESDHVIVFTSSILQIWITDDATNNVTIESLITANRAAKNTK